MDVLLDLAEAMCSIRHVTWQSTSPPQRPLRDCWQWLHPALCDVGGKGARPGHNFSPEKYMEQPNLPPNLPPGRSPDQTVDTRPAGSTLDGVHMHYFHGVQSNMWWRHITPWSLGLPEVKNQVLCLVLSLLLII